MGLTIARCLDASTQARCLGASTEIPKEEKKVEIHPIPELVPGAPTRGIVRERTPAPPAPAISSPRSGPVL